MIFSVPIFNIFTYFSQNNSYTLGLEMLELFDEYSPEYNATLQNYMALH
jgi:hypothetical protein